MGKPRRGAALFVLLLRLWRALCTLVTDSTPAELREHFCVDHFDIWTDATAADHSQRQRLLGRFAPVA